MKKTLIFVAPRSRLSRVVVLAVCAVTFIPTLGLSGCPKSGSGAPTGPDPYVNMTGNWQLQATPTAGGTPFVALSGNFVEEASTATAHATTASLLAQSTGCYATSGTVPLRGNVQQPKVSLTSFNVDGQVLTLSAQKDIAADTLTGTYSIAGGCANGAKGNLTGARYSALSGTFNGAVAADATKTIQLTLSQATLGTSGGTFLIGGSAVFGGLTCLTKGSIVTAQSYVSGSSVVLTFNTNSMVSTQVVLLGTFNQAANAIAVNSFQIVGGSCAATYTNAALTLQS